MPAIQVMQWLSMKPDKKGICSKLTGYLLENLLQLFTTLLLTNNANITALQKLHIKVVTVN